MKIIYIAVLSTVLAASCVTPEGEITARPDPNVSTSGTLGSVKATDGARPLGNSLPVPRDTTQEKHP
jgi:hypothetical protein